MIDWYFVGLAVWLIYLDFKIEFAYRTLREDIVTVSRR